MMKISYFDLYKNKLNVIRIKIKNKRDTKPKGNTTKIKTEMEKS